MNILVAGLSITNIVGLGIIIWLYISRRRDKIQQEEGNRNQHPEARTKRANFRLIQYLYGLRPSKRSELLAMNHANTISGVHERRQSVFKVLQPKSEGIVFLGDSMIQTCEWSELLPSLGGINRGIAGDTIADLLARLPSIIELSPRQIVLMAGINDLRHETCDLTNTLSRYQMLLTTISTQLPNTQTVVHSVLPINPEIFSQRFRKNGSHINPSITTFNQQLQRLVADCGFDYLDLATLLRNECDELASVHTVDGLHLSGEAYVLWAEQLVSVLAPISCSTLPTPVESPSCIKSE